MEATSVTPGEMAAAAPLLDRVDALFGEMERDFADAAARHGFSCRGCDASCCGERFHHHTLAELLHLARGVAALDGRRRGEIFRRARAALQRETRQDREGKERPIACPLNEEGRCALYAARPMICRLHGVPYVLHAPGRPPRGGSGCRRFEAQHGVDGAAPLDRSGHYAALAAVEGALREILGRRERRRRTVAGMLVEIDEAGLAREGGA